MLGVHPGKFHRSSRVGRGLIMFDPPNTPQLRPIPEALPSLLYCMVGSQVGVGLRPMRAPV